MCIRDSILSFIPHITNPGEKSSKDALVLKIYDALFTSVKTDRVLWCGQLGKYLDSTAACVADNSYLADIYPSGLLSEIMGERRGWVLPSLTSGLKVVGNDTVRQLGLERVNPEKILRRITKEILASQSDEWLKSWYKSLRQVKNLWRKDGTNSLVDDKN